MSSLWSIFPQYPVPHQSSSGCPPAHAASVSHVSHTGCTLVTHCHTPTTRVITTTETGHPIQAHIFFVPNEQLLIMTDNTATQRRNASSSDAATAATTTTAAPSSSATAASSSTGGINNANNSVFGPSSSSSSSSARRRSARSCRSTPRRDEEYRIVDELPEEDVRGVGRWDDVGGGGTGAAGGGHGAGSRFIIPPPPPPKYIFYFQRF